MLPLAFPLVLNLHPFGTAGTFVSCQLRPELTVFVVGISQKFPQQMGNWARWQASILH